MVGIDVRSGVHREGKGGLGCSCACSCSGCDPLPCPPQSRCHVRYSHRLRCVQVGFCNSAQVCDPFPDMDQHQPYPDMGQHPQKCLPSSPSTHLTPTPSLAGGSGLLWSKEEHEQDTPAQDDPPYLSIPTSCDPSRPFPPMPSHCHPTLTCPASI
eukprot:229971-Rhodomonas_salina.8